MTDPTNTHTCARPYLPGGDSCASLPSTAESVYRRRLLGWADGWIGVLRRSFSGLPIAWSRVHKSPAELLYLRAKYYVACQRRRGWLNSWSHPERVAHLNAQERLPMLLSVERPGPGGRPQTPGESAWLPRTAQATNNTRRLTPLTGAARTNAWRRLRHRTKRRRHR